MLKALQTPDDTLDKDEARSHTLTQIEKWLSIVTMILILVVVCLGAYVWDLHNTIDTLNHGVTSNGRQTLINRETGYKNRAIGCAVYRNMVNRPTPLGICDDPHVTKYLGTGK